MFAPDANESRMETKTFEGTGISVNLVKTVKELGFIEPTLIQSLVIPYVLNTKKDLLAFAQTGTGKTAAFGLPIIDQINANSPITQAIILCPTRELCVQVANDLTDYSKNMANINVIAVYGGASIENQISKLRKGVQIVVGTPGRVMDLINRKQLKINNVDFLVLDEADEMLSMGFKDELDNILSTTPDTKRTLLFSATMLKEVKEIARKYMHEHEEITAGKANSGAENVNHHYYLVTSKNRYLAVKRIADIYPDIYGIVFCRTRAETKEVADQLIQDGYNADALHGDLSQPQRDMVMKRFRMKNIQLLVATDVAARGLDVNDLTHIINYNIPQESEIYVHRSGRTGRAGKSGISILLLSSRELHKLKTIEKMLGKQFVSKQIPKGHDVCEKQLFHFIDKMENVQIDEEQIGQFLPAILSKLSWLERDELIKRFISIEFNRFAEYYKDASDLNEKESYSRDRNKRDDFRDREKPYGKNRNDRDRRDDRERPPRRETDKRQDRERHQKDRENRGSNTKFSRIFLNIGNKNGLAPRDIIDMINNSPELRKAEIGKIEILKKFSFFEIEKAFDATVQTIMTNQIINGVTLSAEIALPKNEERPDYKKGKSYGSEKKKEFSKTKRKEKPAFRKDKKRGSNRSKSY